MSARTAPQHTAAELVLIGADTITGIVAYATQSQHDANRTNIVSLDTQTGETFCTCRASECNHPCWHVATVRVAWHGEQAQQEVIWLTDAQLVRYGRKHRLVVDTYTARIGRSRLDDRIALLVARGEYRRRVRLGLIERAVAALPVAA